MRLLFNTIQFLLCIGLLGQLQSASLAWRADRGKTDDWCTEAVHHERSETDVKLRNESHTVYIECPVRVSPRRSRCGFRVEWYKDGEAIQFSRSGVSRSHPFFRVKRKGRRLYFTRVLFSHAGNYTCRIAHPELYPVKNQPGCHGNHQDPMSCYPAESFKDVRVTVTSESHPAIVANMPNYPPGSPEQLEPGRLYMPRNQANTWIELNYRGQPQTEPLDCRFLLAHPRRAAPVAAPRVEWFHSHNLGEIGRYEFRRVVASSRPGYVIRPPEVVPCRPEDFGFAYLGEEWRRSDLTTTCYSASIRALVVNDWSHGYYRCNATYGNSSLSQHSRLGISADWSRLASSQRQLDAPVVDFTKNFSACLGGHVQLDCRVEPAASSVVIARIFQPVFSDFGELVNYSSFDRLATYWHPDGLGNRSSGSIGSVHLSIGSRDVRLKLTIDSATADLDGYYGCFAKSDRLYDRSASYCRLEVLRQCVVGEAASRLSALADAARLQIIVYAASGGLAASFILGALILIYYIARRRTDPIRKRLRVVCLDNSGLYSANVGRRQQSDAEASASSQTGSVATASTARLLVPEVRVERIGSRSRWGFGSRRSGDSEDYGGSGSTKINREVRYMIPSCPVLEVDRKRVQMFRLLGEGAFGSVHSGQLLMGNKPKDVAIKMLKRNYTEEELLALFKEMEIMKLMNRNPHPNIIKLVGVSTKNGPFLLLVELAHHGNLRDFLKDRCLAERVPLQYHNVHPETKRMQHIPCVSGQLLLQFATDVANALDFMASIKIVHRDVAARNILVANSDAGDGGLVAKVADFGLTRNVQDKDYYRVINEGKLPVKWLAPECLRSRIFSTESDVWAYGILLYEIYSFGQLPYPGVSPGDILGQLELGRVNACPKFAGQAMYALMRRCWTWEPKERPTFADILDRLGDMRLAGGSLAPLEPEEAADASPKLDEAVETKQALQ